jgi:monothiol glutaredoxin
MGIRSKIKDRLKSRLGIVSADPPRPASTYTTSNSESSERPAYTPPPRPEPLSPEQSRAAFEAETKANPVFLYLKGTPRQPQCGFSAAVVAVFDELGFPYETRNVLDDPNVRHEIKEFSDWPTIPQIYVGGEFVGGCDIVREMAENGELKTLVEKAVGGAAAG